MVVAAEEAVVVREVAPLPEPPPEAIEPAPSESAASPFAPEENATSRDAALLDALPASLLAKLDELFRTRPERVIRIDSTQYLK